MTRRAWLAGSLLGGIGLSARAVEPDKPAADPAEELAPILARARKVKLGRFRSSRTQHYLGVGNAPDLFRNGALEICEALAKEYKRYYADPRFAVSMPKQRLTVITLKDRRSYQAYLGETTGEDVGGHYDLETNQLMIFDFRGDADDLAVPATRLNTFTLVHEGLHQLTFNTGLLSREGDVPVAISEGLAMYGELWQKSNRQATFGVVNSGRLGVLMNQEEGADPWIPVSRLLTRDELFTDPETHQLAYAEAWVLVHYLMSMPRRAKFQAYLAALRERRMADERLKDAAKAFGDLARLDKDVKRYSRIQARA